mgnify:CR=1 FL=1
MPPSKPSPASCRTGEHSFPLVPLALIRENEVVEALGCPEGPPEWMASWPGAESLTRGFPSGIRAYAARLVRKERHRALTWQTDRLVLRLGSQRTIWALQGGNWRASCSCGYHNSQCPHAYAAAKLFEEVAEAQGWTGKGKSAADGKPASDARTERRTPPRTGAASRTQPNFTWDTTPTDPASLLAEVDVHHEPGSFVLRFFRVRDGERSWLSLQSLFNLCRRAKDGRLDNYPERDVRFLAWLGGRLDRRRIFRSRLKVVKLTAEQFGGWQDAWANQPGRFIERSSQKPFGQSSSAKMHFELSPKGDRVEIAAVVDLPDGTALPYHELLRSTTGDGKGFMVEGGLVQVAPPVSAGLLKDVFSRKSPTMDKRHVTEYLSDLLEHRLDLVRGPAIRREEKTAPARLSLTPDGAGFAGEITVRGKPYHPASGCAVGALRSQGDRFLLQLLLPEDDEAVRRFLRVSGADVESDGRFRISGAQQNVAALVEAWAELPKAVVANSAAELQPLLAGVGPATADVQTRSAGATVEFDVLWQCGGRTLTGGEVRDVLKSGTGIVRTSSGQWLRMSPDDMERTARTFESLGTVTGATLLVPEAREALADLDQDPNVDVSGLDRGRATSILTRPAPTPLSLPPHLESVLRSYQLAGFEFLAQRTAFRTGPLLADDMGLGKTLQVLALLDAVRRNGGLPVWDGGDRGEPSRSLVVCPASVTAVWLEEARRFCPDLRCRLYRGTPEERPRILAATDWDVLVANFAIVRQDEEFFRDTEFELVVLDEAQAIKNPDAQTTRAVKSIPRRCGMAATGTPLENRALDLWSIEDFLNPGFLGNQEEFLEGFPPGAPDTGVRLASRVRPVLLRRTKAEVAPELPPLTQEVIAVEMGEEQRGVYLQHVQRARQAVAGQGAMELLAALTRLRQACCHPDLLPGCDGVPSGKLAELLRMVEELVSEGHSALVFSQFVQMLELIRPELERRGVPHFTITGKTPVEQRQERIAQFNQSETPAVFLLSIKAAGTGITLTRADYVFIYDPWWNPAVERQAIDRTHRIGQDNPVMAYRLIAADSVEERVLALQREKADLFEQVVGTAENAVPQGLTREDLAALLLPA